MNVDLSVHEIEILAVLAINAVELGQFGTGVEMHPTLVNRLKEAHSKLLDALRDYEETDKSGLPWR